MPERVLRAGVIGAGWYAAQNHIPVLAARQEVVLDGVCRLGQAELERVRSHFGFAFASERFEDVLARKPDIVVVASPHHLHYRHAAAALEAGAHVLCEKPLTLDPAEAWDLVAKAEAHGRHLVVANGYQYLPQVDDLRRRIADGAIGAIEHVMVSFISATRDVFTGDRGLNSWRTTFFRPDPSTWQDPANGGGFAYGQLSHALAMMYFLTGLEPEAIAAFSVASDHVDIAEAGALRFTSGAVASISGAAAMPQGNRALLRLFITGDAGLLTAEFDRDLCEIRRFSGEVEHLPLKADDWVYRCDGPVHALVDLALGRGANLSPGAVGATTAATIASLLQSAGAGGAPQAILGRNDRV
ncbi:Gfo/Idh/MocA family protein [Chelatococcus asaccharovorans]|uniref:Gfo/Idh/MocA family protein n=1 Tax=Chelatococcus asaccharovorans TaxID=28210 RepID=UPI00224C7084|nr:Gfo/Idh/MocA family oxidoreductase [Chelatococcus asaccharovorans]CAH1654047.1 putative dehydrogenase [Chelatococcus asaccharovorans]CAH1694473.1 putative dehydrogenase [Chelatococcus asaccharovorans]